MGNVNTIQMSISLNGADGITHDLNKVMGGIQNLGSRAVSMAKDFIYLYGAVKAWQALMSVPMEGLKFAKEMETAKLGIGSIIMATQDLITQDGRRLAGMEKFNQAQLVARDVMKELQIAGLETTATTEQLVIGYQALLGPASAAGFTLTQTKDVTVMMVQAMGALGININQLSAEGRSLLDGSIIPTQDRLAIALGITGEMVKKWKEQGVLFEELQKKLEPFKLAGGALAETWAGLASNIKEAVAFVGSQTMGGVFEQVKEGWKSMLATLIDTKNFDVGGGIKELLAGAKVVADDIGKALRWGMEGFVELLKRASTYIGENKTEMAGVWIAVKGVGSEFANCLGEAIKLAGSIAHILITTGALEGAIRTVQIALAYCADVINIMKLGVLGLAWAISGTVLKAIEGWLLVLGNAANWFKKGWGDGLIEIAGSYKGFTDAIGAEVHELGSQYKNGLLPNMTRALTQNKQTEASMNNQNKELENMIAKIKSLAGGQTDQKKAKEKLFDAGLAEQYRAYENAEKSLAEAVKTNQLMIELAHTQGHFSNKEKLEANIAVERQNYEDRIQMAKDMIAKLNAEYKAKGGWGSEKDWEEYAKRYDKYTADMQKAEEDLTQVVLKGEIDRTKLIKQEQEERAKATEKAIAEEIKKEEEKQKKLLELKMQEINLIQQARQGVWQPLMDTNNLIGGAAGQGMGSITAGAKGMTDTVAGVDPYSEKITQYQEHLNRQIELQTGYNLQKELLEKEAVKWEDLTLQQRYEKQKQFTADMINNENFTYEERAAMNESFIRMQDMQDSAFAQQKIYQYQMAATMVAGVLTSLSAFVGKNNYAMFIAQKALAMTMAILNTAQGVTAALALGPPGIPLAGIIKAMGYAQIALIAAQTLAGPGKASAGMSGGSAGGYSYTNPTQPSWQEEKKEETPRSPVINVHVYADVVDENSLDGLARKMIPALEKQWSDNVH